MISFGDIATQVRVIRLQPSEILGDAWSGEAPSTAQNSDTLDAHSVVENQQKRVDCGITVDILASRPPLGQGHSSRVTV
jgi:hypothetical protein